MKRTSEGIVYIPSVSRIETLTVTLCVLEANIKQKLAAG